MHKDNGKYFSEYQRRIREAKGNICLLECKVPVEIQKSFFGGLHLLLNKRKIATSNDEEFETYVTQLYNEEVSIDDKKQVVLELSVMHSVKAYRALQEYEKSVSEDLKYWLILGLTISKMLIEMELSGEKRVLISTGMGGKGEKIRYEAIFIAKGGNSFEAYQKKEIVNEFDYFFKHSNCEIEHLDVNMRYVRLLFLMPITLDIKSFIKPLLDECNKYGDFLSKTFIISNEKEFSEEEIEEAIKKEYEENNVGTNP